MSAFLGNVTELIGLAFGANGWVAKIVTCITASGNELLLVGFVLSIGGFAIGCIKRLTNLG